ncbi:MAG: NACHT domain-containing protein [Cyanobacteria bacterium J06560_5]
MAEEAISVFLSYSHNDLEMLTELNKHLAGLRRTNKIKTWDDSVIGAGDEWESAIQEQLNTADIIILLISADFIASDYCYGNELQRAIERHDTGEARVIPVILKPCLWNDSDIPFSKLNVLPDYARAITQWDDSAEAYTNVAKGISNTVEMLRDRRKAEPTSSKIQDIFHNLPQPDYEKFVGRDQELTKIFEKLRPYPHSQIAVITIDGIGGIGKSALALEIAHRFLRGYEGSPVEEKFEAIIWASAKQVALRPDQGIVTRQRSFQTLKDIFSSIAFTLAIEEQVHSRESEILEFICRALTKKRTLLIIDNLESVDDEAVMEFLKDWLPAPTKAIVTTRHRIDVAYPIRLVGMEWEDSKQLIDQECQGKNVQLDFAQKERLYKRTGGVPLAIVWTIARIGLGHKINTVLASLGKHQGDLAHFCFKEVINHIRERDSYRLLLALTVCEGKAERKKLNYVSGFEEDEFSCDEGLVELDVLSLVSREGDIFTMLPLTKAYVVHELKFNALFEREVRRRLSDWVHRYNKIFVDSLRAHCRRKILAQHSRMRLLSGAEIGVDQLYVDVWLLKKPENRHFNTSESLLKKIHIETDRLLLSKRIQRNPGFEIANNQNKIVVLGKPGSGKTTFLKHLAVDWCKGRFQPSQLAVFIELRRIREKTWDLINAIGQELALKERAEVLSLLKHGSLFVLMDGFDEVPTAELRHSVQEQINQVSQQYHKDNRFVLTCRTQIMSAIPNGFTSVEVADFSSEQVRQFVQNWFTANGHSESEATQQWKTLQRTITSQADLRELMVTPILLNLMCVVWQDSGEIPKNRASIYERGITWSLHRWNDEKKIKGWEVGTEAYRKLSIEDKKTLLTEIAARKFENPENFVLFERDELVEQISEILQLANEQEGLAVLKAIESQHGLLIERADELWSFSSLTFQEYFTVQWLTQLPPQQLTAKISNQQWQRTVEQLVKSQQPADRLLRLIKQAIDRLTTQDPVIQAFLSWLLHKSSSFQSKYKLVAIRAFYYSLTLDSSQVLDIDLTYAPDFDLNRAYTRALDSYHALDLGLDRSLDLVRALDLVRVRTLAPAIDLDFTRNLAHSLARDFAITHDLDISSDFISYLRQLKKELPTSTHSNEIQDWWLSNGAQWSARLQRAMVKYRNLGHDWQFTENQKQQLKHYYGVNIFLADLMKIKGAVSKECRVEIEEGLLLPWTELQRRQPHIYGELKA